MQDKIFDVSFQVDGIIYSGWVNPSEKAQADGRPASYHVVLNGVSFGYLSFNDCTWSVNEERPKAITDAAGAAIEKHYQL